MRGKLFMAPWSVAMENACARVLIACDIINKVYVLRFGLDRSSTVTLFFTRHSLSAKVFEGLSS